MDRNTRTALLVAAVGLVLTLWRYQGVRALPYVYEDAKSTHATVTTLPQSFPGRWLSAQTFAVTAPHGAAVDHLTNAGLHIVNGALVGAIGTAMSGPIAGAVVAGLFWLHPAFSEPALYVSGRTELLMTFGTLFALWALWWPAGWVRVTGMILGLAIAGLSKEAGLMALPLVVVTGWFMDRPAPSLLLAALVVGAFVVSAQGFVAWVGMNPKVGGTSLPYAEWLNLQVSLVARELTLLVIPVGQSIEHDATQTVPTWSRVAGIALGAGPLLALAASSLHWPAAKHLLWAGVFVAVALAPRLLIPTAQFLTETHVYLPGAAVLLACGGFVHAWTRQGEPGYGRFDLC